MQQSECMQLLRTQYLKDTKQKNLNVWQQSEVFLKSDQHSIRLKKKNIMRQIQIQIALHAKRSSSQHSEKILVKKITFQN